MIFCIKLKYYLSFFIVLCCLNSCSKKDDTLVEWSSEQLQLKASVRQSLGSPVISWENQDSIGLLMKASGTAGLSQLMETNRRFNYNSANSIFELVGNSIYQSS